MTDIRNVLAARDAVLQRNAALRGIAQPTRTPGIESGGQTGGGAFAAAFDTALRAAPAGATPAVPVVASTGIAGPESIGSTLSSLLARVNATQEQEDVASEAYERGETTDIASVMLTSQRASIGFEATLQVRNKLLSAYKDIMSMQI